MCFVIEDDPDDQEIFSMALEKINPSMQCCFANDGIEAMEKLNTGNFVPDYIFIDLNMPRMGGTQCLQEIKKLQHLNDIPLVIYSTSSEDKFKDELKKIGATEYLVKPTKISILIENLSSFFRRY
jgi:CheY-like chemotaxis protein